MHHSRVISNNQIPFILPLHTNNILRSGSPADERPGQLPTFRFGETLDMMHMRPDVEVGAAAGFVELGEAVAVHGVVQRVEVGEVDWGAAFAAVVEGVYADVVVAEQALL